MQVEIIPRHLVTLFTILLFAIRLWHQKSFRNTEVKYFWLTLIMCLVLVAEDILESLAALDPSLRVIRFTASIIGYTCRSIAALSLLLVVIPKGKRSNLLWIPCVITFLVCCTAFFSDVAFGYDENYKFYRGPLGYVVFVVPILYLLITLWIVFRNFTEKKSIQWIITPLCVVFCLTASLSDTFYGGIRLNEAMMISSAFFYMVLFSHDNRRDPMTELLNRQAFYEDCTRYDRSIGAIMSIDMNGLKELNDTRGHSAGDEALTHIGRCLQDASDRNAMAYRVGGDEFIILFLHSNEEEISRVENQIRRTVAERGYSVSTGHIIRDQQRSLDEVIVESDRRMYADKANHYRMSGFDRRRRGDRGPKPEA